jgi:hypothetical protein
MAGGAFSATGFLSPERHLELRSASDTAMARRLFFNRLKPVNDFALADKGAPPPSRHATKKNLGFHT